MATSHQIARLTIDLGELVSTQERRTRDHRNFTKYAHDPVGFLRDVLKSNPWWRQVEIAEAVRDHPMVAVRSANSIGKDWLAARLALWWIYAVGGRVLLTGPTDRQVSEVLVRREIAQAFRIGKLPGDLGTRALRIPPEEEGRLLAFTSNEASKLTGFHGARIMVVITEAQGVEDFAYEALLSCATGTHDRILAVGNPTSPEGRFFSISQIASQWVKVKIPASDHPNVAERREVIPGACTPSFVERIRKEFGVDSPQYISRVLAEFPEDAEHGLITRAHLEAAVARFDSSAMVEEARASGWTVGVDVARYGDDSTCVAIRRGPILWGIKTWHGADTMETTGRVIEALRARHFRPSQVANPLFATDPSESFGPGIMTSDLLIIVDVIGLGSGVLDRLNEQGWPAMAHHSSSRPRDPSRFVNRRAETYWTLRLMLEEGKIALPRDETLFEELLATNWFINSTGKIQIEDKKDLKSRLGRSPDRADAVTMAFATDPATGGGAMVNL
jgi:phage terminase large subunit